LDEAIDDAWYHNDMYAVTYVRMHNNPAKRRKISDEDPDLRPIAFVRLNTRKGKPKPITIRALLDSGGGGCLVNEKLVQKLNAKTTKATQVWTTPGGNLNTDRMVKTTFTMPELHDNRVIEWDLHVTKSCGVYDMIIGRDLLAFLGIDIRFSSQTVQWDASEIPFKDPKLDILESYHIDDSQAIVDRTNKIKEILDAKYEAADLELISSSQKELTPEEQKKLHKLLDRYSLLFDGTLGKWHGTEVDLKLKQDATPYHARAYPIPKCHQETLKQEVDRLVQIGVLKKVNRSEWAAPTFIIPKKDGTVRFISDF
jgi:hypothetical protein